MVKYIFLTLLVLPLVACDEKDSHVYNLPEQTLAIQKANGDVVSFTAELALTPQEMATGLMFREEMTVDHAMLFYFGGGEVERRFWMKNTLIPLDMIFIKANGTIHKIHSNAIPHDLTSISSDGPVAAVLEVNGGLSAELGIFAGDKVKHSFFEQKTVQ